MTPNPLKGAFDLLTLMLWGGWVVFIVGLDGAPWVECAGLGRIRFGVLGLILIWE